MPTRMVHPKHGTTYAVGSEVEWNKAHGWRVEAKPLPVVAPVAAPPVGFTPEFLAPTPMERVEEARAAAEPQPAAPRPQQQQRGSWRNRKDR